MTFLEKNALVDDDLQHDKAPTLEEQTPPVTSLPIEGQASSDVFLELLAAKVATKVNGHESSESNGARRFLGLSRGSWTKMLLAWFMTILVALAAWHLAIRDELHERPTNPQIEKSVLETFQYHNDSSQAHPPIQRRLDGIEVEQKTIRESQIEQATNDRQQTKVLDEIAKDVKRLRRRR